MPLVLAFALAALPGPALAAGGIDGRSLGPVWAIPFVGILLSIAILPQVAHRFWDRRMGLLSAGWALAALVPLGLAQGFGVAAEAALHVLLTEYGPFVLLLFALYVIAGGIVVAGNLHGSPAVNTALLAFGAAAASLVGTTGASLVLIRPLLRANDERPRNVHVVVFFIFLVSNVGGALTPLGDPPLFLGYLRGVEFFWTTRNLLAPTLLTAGLLLALFYALDSWIYRRDGVLRPDPTPDSRLRLRGGLNIALLLLLVGAVLLSGAVRTGVDVPVGPVRVPLESLARDAALAVLAVLSLLFTEGRNRAANDFSWRPIVEVAIIFAGIFACLLPVAAALGAGREGAFGGLLALVSRPDGSPNPLAYFWLTGALSSFLDNAPTYLVFFELAGGDAARLMGPLAPVLTAISLGAVFMGANTYIGNAPNLLVYALAKTSGVAMPSFGGYMLWSGAILLPVFALVSLVFLR